MPSRDIAAAAQALLDLAAAVIPNPPTRQYRSTGIPAWDFVEAGLCDSQLTVWVTSAVPGMPGAPTTGRPQHTASWLRSYTFVVELARGAPTGDGTAAPTAAELDVAARRHLDDFQALDQWMRELGRSNEGLPDALVAAGVAQVAQSGLVTVGPQGGVVGLRATVTLAI